MSTATTLSPRFLRRFGGPLLGAAIAAGAMLGPSVARAEGLPKIAVIDVRRAIAETEEGLRVQSKLKKLFESRQADIETKTRQLQTDKEALEKDAQRGVSKDVLTKKYEKLVQLDQDIQRATMEAQREMARKEQEMTAPIYAGILEAVKRIAAQEGYEMVLEKSAVPFFRGDLELTDRAIQMYNGGAAKGSSAPKGAPAPAPGKPASPAPAPKK
jgi:outer membrane protein